jgi:hypothetical protein
VLTVKLRTLIALSLAALGVSLLATRFRRKPRPVYISSKDLSYQEHSPEELASEDLLDLNTATQDDLLKLRLDAETSDRILENRPYRNKLDLLSRMVISEPAYDLIKNQVGIARATEPVKLGG